MQISLTIGLSNIDPTPREPVAKFGVKPDVIQSTPKFWGVGSTPSDTHSVLSPPPQIACINLRKNKILAGSFNQVAGVTDLPPPDLNPSKTALPIGFGQI
jgi:hypothetical protein